KRSQLVTFYCFDLRQKSQYTNHVMTIDLGFTQSTRLTKPAFTPLAHKKRAPAGALFAKYR
ncbi:MAG: hypothetical protein RR566_04545, partial [Comamonas sp.]